MGVRRRRPTDARVKSELVTKWLAWIPNDATKQTYKNSLYRIFPEPRPTEFLQLAKSDLEASEELVADWIIANRNLFTGRTCKTTLGAISSFARFHHIRNLDLWRAYKACPGNGVTEKRAAKLEEIRVIFDKVDTRGKFIISLLVSSGVRIGALDYFSLKDFQIKVVEGKEIAWLTVYRGEAERYTSLGSNECVQLFRKYIAERERVGENLTPDSPFIRNRVNPFGPSKVEKSGSHDVTIWLQYLWNSSGFKQREFEQTRGIDRFFKVKLESEGMKSIFVEMIAHGHGRKLGTTYFCSDDDLAKEYAKYEQFLTVSEAGEVKRELTRERQETQREVRSVIVESAETKERMKEKDAEVQQLKIQQEHESEIAN